MKHTAFIELNRKAVVDVVYGDGDYKRYKERRLLAVDGSKTALPDTESVIKEFGRIRYSNAKPGVSGTHAYGLASVLYDVLNRVAVDSVLGKAKDYEVNLAMGHLPHTVENDLILCDRNYASYVWLAALVREKRDFLVRCSASSFSTARRMLKGEGADSQTAVLKVPSGKRRETRQQQLPEAITVRFVRVTLDTGEYEVLVTSLLDENEYPTEEFKTLYRFRWCEETFYGILKTRLELENFTGKTAESVYQDFYAAVYLTGMESIFTAETDAELAEKPTRHKQQVNRAVSFNAIKNHALEILFSDEDSDTVLKKLEALFLTNPTCSRENRNPPRKPRSTRRLLNYCRRRRKICF